MQDVPLTQMPWPETKITEQVEVHELPLITTEVQEHTAPMVHHLPQEAVEVTIEVALLHREATEVPVALQEATNREVLHLVEIIVAPRAGPVLEATVAVAPLAADPVEAIEVPAAVPEALE